MGCIVPTAMDRERDDQCMPYEWFVGIDWGSQRHQVCVLDRDRRLVGERAVDHDGASLAQLGAWLWTLSAGQPQRVAVAIEVPRGRLSRVCSTAASTSLRLIPSNSTGSGIVTARREPRMIGAMPLSWPIPFVPISRVFVGSTW